MTTQFQDIPLAKLEAHPHNIRRQLHDIDELAASIKSKGIVQALTVAPHPTAKTKFIVLGGHRRLSAAKIAKIKTAPCMVRPDLNTPELQTEFMIVENTQRNDLTPMEEARAYQTLLDLPGYNAKRISENTGRKHRLVSDRIKLAKISDPVATKLDDGQITLEQAMVFAEFTDDEDATQKLLQVAGTYDWLYRVQALRRKKTAVANIAVTTRELTAASATILESRPEAYPWGGDYARAPEVSIDEHIAAGHLAIVDVDSDGKPEWAVLRSQMPDPEPQQLDAEEIANRENYQRMTAGLDVAAHVRRKFLEEVIQPSYSRGQEDLAEKIVRRSVIQDLQGDAVGCELLGIPIEESDEARCRAAVQKLDIWCLVILLDIINNSPAEEKLLYPETWGPMHGWDYTSDWRESLVADYGYQFSEIEREAMDRLKPAEDGEDAA
ncbi:ParB/RepB/Spo0J family partition protein [Arthrobacter sp. HLT1-21]